MDERNQQTERVTRRAQQNAANASGGQHVQEFGAAKMREPSYMRAKDEQQQQPVQDESKDPVVFESLDQIFQVIEKIDEIIQGGKRIPLSKSLVIVDAGEINDLLGQLRLRFPRTVKEAKQIIAQQDQILEQACECHLKHSSLLICTVFHKRKAKKKFRPAALPKADGEARDGTCFSKKRISAGSAYSSSIPSW